MPALLANPGQAILYITLILWAIGTVTIFSASFVMAGRETGGDSYFYLKRHLMAFAIGMGLLWAAGRFDYRRYRWLAAALLLLTFAALILVPVMGIEVNGARRWLKLGTTFQPSELAKLTTVVVSAAYLGWRVDKGRPVTLVSWPFGLTLAMGGLVLLQPDMGTAVVICALCVLVYILAGIPVRQWAGLLFLGGGALFMAVAMAPYRKDRIAAWLDPWSHQQDLGYQAVQSLLAIGSGGLGGTGLGMGASKFFYLPEAHTDFAFAVLSQEMGFAGVAAVLTLFLLIGLYGSFVAIRAADGYGMLLAAGATALIVCQAMGNMAMVCGILPVTGVPLPYISYGGTALIVNLAATGLLISVARTESTAVPSSGDPAPVPDHVQRDRRRLRLANRPSS